MPYAFMLSVLLDFFECEVFSVVAYYLAMALFGAGYATEFSLPFRLIHYVSTAFCSKILHSINDDKHFTSSTTSVNPTGIKRFTSSTGSLTEPDVSFSVSPSCGKHSTKPMQAKRKMHSTTGFLWNVDASFAPFGDSLSLHLNKYSRSGT